jgi:predicted polyphosphate/ATP-dependent NAD kinase
MSQFFSAGNNMRIGFIVNPIAGMGGKVGLKGTDGVLKEALLKGALPVAPLRAVEFLADLKQRISNYTIEILCCPNVMGTAEAKAAGFPVQVLPLAIGEETSAKDTENAVKQLTDEKVDLIVFVGGDGTARDILNAMKEKAITPVLGVPAGVKMYSGVFAINPSDAADVVVAFVEGRADTVDTEVMDADENAIRNDIFDVKLHGYLKGLSVPMLMQGSKEVSPETINEKEQQTSIAQYVVKELPPEATLILGPGTTVERIAENLGVKKTILGVDIYHKGKVQLDVDEKTLIEKIQDWHSTWLILSPIGHQGILLGRGNQQISSKVIRLLDKKHIVIVATMHKLRSIEGGVLRVDTGDPEVDQMLRGNVMVVVDYQMGIQVPVQ